MQINPDDCATGERKVLQCSVSIVSIHADQSRLRLGVQCKEKASEVSIVSIHADQSRLLSSIPTIELTILFQSYQFMQINPDNPTIISGGALGAEFQSYQFRQINPDLLRTICVYLLVRFQSYQFRQINPDRGDSES